MLMLVTRLHAALAVCVAGLMMRAVVGSLGTVIGSFLKSRAMVVKSRAMVAKV